MRNLVILVGCLAFLFLAAHPLIAAIPGVGSITLMPGENWFAVPVIPFDPQAASVFSGIDLVGNLARFDPLSQSVVPYDPSHPDNFPLLMGDGYILNYHGPSAITISYAGVILDREDAWISLPGATNGGGMNWIGVPYLQDVLLDTIIVTNGVESFFAPEAIDRGWLAPLWTTMNRTTQTTETAGALTNSEADTHYLRGGYMYKVETYQSDLAFILPLPTPEPASLLSLMCALGGLAAIRLKTRRARSS